MLRSAASLVALCLVTVTAPAALLGRIPLTPGGTDYQAYYDTSTNLTWLADANLLATNTFGITEVETNIPGKVPWDSANEWITAMNSASYLGVADWRLPTVTDTGTPGCDDAYTGTDCGYNVDLATGEMARMYYSTLGNTGLRDTSGALTGCSNILPACLTNAGPFRNLLGDFYWSGTRNVGDPDGAIWIFAFDHGMQGSTLDWLEAHAWAMRDGDIDADTDGDGVLNGADNCTLVANPNQLDADDDGYGTSCDGDLNNSGLVTATDNTLLRGVLNQLASASATAAAADLNGSGTVTATDNTLLRNRLNTAPGPSGLSCAGTIPCP